LFSEGVTRNLRGEFWWRISESFCDSAAKRGSIALSGSGGLVS
jgi:hypothetical protein